MITILMTESSDVSLIASNNDHYYLIQLPHTSEVCKKAHNGMCKECAKVCKVCKEESGVHKDVQHVRKRRYSVHG